MKTRRKLLPGQPDTIKLLEQYGEDLVCVRYRYDSQRKIKMKTAEIIVERGPWVVTTKRIPVGRIVSIRIDYGEVELGIRVRSAGAKWNRDRRLWELAYEDVVALGLEERIVPDGK